MSGTFIGKVEKQRCFNDCNSLGCPGHSFKLYVNTSGYVEFIIDDSTEYILDPDFFEAAILLWLEDRRTNGDK